MYIFPLSYDAKTKETVASLQKSVQGSREISLVRKPFLELASTEQGSIDLALVDLTMDTGMSGDEVAKFIIPRLPKDLMTLNLFFVINNNQDKSLLEFVHFFRESIEKECQNCTINFYTPVNLFANTHIIQTVAGDEAAWRICYETTQKRRSLPDEKQSMATIIAKQSWRANEEPEIRTLVENTNDLIKWLQAPTIELVQFHTPRQPTLSP